MKRCVMSTLTFNNSECCLEFMCQPFECHYLILARKCSAIEDHGMVRVLAEHIGTDLKHDGHTKVILLRRILDPGWRKERGPNGILVQDDGSKCVSHVMRECTFP